MWIIAAFNVGLFLFFFLGFLPPNGRLEWRNLGIVTAFLVALFSEMHGFPLTIYLLTGWLGDAYPVLEPFNHKFGPLWVVVFGGSNLAWALVMTASLILMISGYVLLAKGWRQVHGGKGRIVAGPGIPDPPTDFPVTLQEHRHRIPGHLKVVSHPVLGGCITNTGWHQKLHEYMRTTGIP